MGSHHAYHVASSETGRSQSNNQSINRQNTSQTQNMIEEPPECIWVISGPQLGRYAPFVYDTPEEAERMAVDLKDTEHEFFLTRYKKDN